MTNEWYKFGCLCMQWELSNDDILKYSKGKKVLKQDEHATIKFFFVLFYSEAFDKWSCVWKGGEGAQAWLQRGGGGNIMLK